MVYIVCLAAFTNKGMGNPYGGRFVPPGQKCRGGTFLSPPRPVPVCVERLIRPASPFGRVAYAAIAKCLFRYDAPFGCNITNSLDRAGITPIMYGEKIF